MGNLHSTSIQTLDNGDRLPYTALDDVLSRTPLGDTLPASAVKYWSCIDGKELVTEVDWLELYEEAIARNVAGTYTTTDHLILSIEVGGVVFIYISLDNSCRSNQAGVPMKERRGGIFGIIKHVIDQQGGAPCVVFTSEGSRPLFTGANVQDDPNPLYWLEFRNELEEYCGVRFLTERKNNPHVMAFSVSSFYTPGARPMIANYTSMDILGEGFGCAALLVTLRSGESIMATHFPLDFKRTGTDNYNAIAMKTLQSVMKEHNATHCMGDFNKVPGPIQDCMMAAIEPEFKFMSREDSRMITFFPSYFDALPPGLEFGAPSIESALQSYKL